MKNRLNQLSLCSSKALKDMAYWFCRFTRQTIFYFSECSEKIVFPINRTGMWFSCIIRKDGIFFPENLILFFRRKMEDGLCQKIHRNMMFFVYSVKTVLLFPTNMILPFCQKKQRRSSLEKIRLKTALLVSLKKMIFILENMVFLLIEQLKMIKKFTFIKMFQWFSAPLGRPLKAF